MNLSQADVAGGHILLERTQRAGDDHELGIDRGDTAGDAAPLGKVVPRCG